MALDIMSPAHPRMLLCGQLTRIRARLMGCLRLHKFVKFGRGARDGGFATSAAISSYEIILSILLIARSREQSCLLFAKNC